MDLHVVFTLSWCPCAVCWLVLWEACLPTFVAFRALSAAALASTV